MANLIPRILLGSSSLLAAAGGVLHASAFGKAASAIGTANLSRFYAGSSKALWLGDSTTLFILALVFAFIAGRPSAASRAVIVLLAFIPAAVAVLIYTFLGSFFAAHLLLAIAALAFLAGLQFRGATAL